MPKSKNKRKQGRPAAPPRIPILLRINQETNAGMSALIGYAEFTKLEQRVPDEGTWHRLALRLNIGSRLSLIFNDPIISEDMLKSLDMLIKVHERFTRTGIMVAGDPELQVIHQGLRYVEALQARCTAREIQEAYNYVLKHAATT
jgi:hypothetical protein